MEERTDRHFSAGSLSRAATSLSCLSERDWIWFLSNICLIYWGGLKRGGFSVTPPPKKKNRTDGHCQASAVNMLLPLLGNGFYIIFYTLATPNVLAHSPHFKKVSLSASPCFVSVSVLSPPSFLGNSSVNTFPLQRIHTQQEKNC
jgi:hypothetical protein